jgi:hypothetical protein
MPAGTFTDFEGRPWQYQVSVVCAKKDIMEDREKPMQLTRKWAYGLKLRALTKHIVDTIFENK